MGNCARRFRVCVDIRLDSEEPAPEPAPAQEGGAGDELASEISDWDVVSNLQQEASSASSAVAVSSRQVSAPARFYRRQANSRFRPAPVLLVPIERDPTIRKLFHREFRFYVVWEFPDHAEREGIHFSRGSLCWAQIRSHVSASFPNDSPETAFTYLRWYRCLGCDLQQLFRAYRRETGIPGNCKCFLWV